MNKSRFILSSLALMFFLPACTVTAPQADIESISSKTGSLIAQVEFGLKVEDAVLIVRYTDDGEIPTTDKLNNQWLGVMKSLRAIAVYSVDVIDTAELSRKNSPQYIGQLVTHIDKLYSDLGETPELREGLSAINLEAIFDDMRAKSTFIDAVKVSQQAISPVVQMIDALITDCSRSLDEVDLAILKAIDQRHSQVVHYQDTVVLRRDQTLVQLQLLDDARTGDKDAWQSLRKFDMEMQSALASHSSLKQAGIYKAEKVLLNKLKTLSEIQDSLQPDIDLYVAEINELRKVASSADGALTLAQLSIHTWESGHVLFSEGRKNKFALLTDALVQMAVNKGSEKLL